MATPMHYLIPADVAAGTTAEVFEVFRVATQAAHAGTEAWTTVHLRGVDTGREIALGLPQLADLGEPVLTREESDHV